MAPMTPMEDMEWVCPNCDYSFEELHDLYNHVLAKHNDPSAAMLENLPNNILRRERKVAEIIWANFKETRPGSHAWVYDWENPANPEDSYQFALSKIDGAIIATIKTKLISNPDEEDIKAFLVACNAFVQRKRVADLNGGPPLN